ncbi:MAG TPA: acyl-CoA thioesterase [Telmatospirillum sp.]|nr:acyl-CoA thioesterase [Telmatospirillum sp.]
MATSEQTSPTRDVREPRGGLTTRTLCMPADTNPHGDIFGGWLLGQMDIAGGIFSASVAQSRTTAVAVDAMTFLKPVSVGDVICVYTDLIRTGTTSMKVHVEAWVVRRNQSGRLLVTEGNFTYVALDEQGRPQPVHRVPGPDAVVKD